MGISGKKAGITVIAAGLLAGALSGCGLGQSDPVQTDVSETVDTDTGSESKTETEKTTMNDQSKKESGFYKSKLTDDLMERIEGKSFKEDCILSADDLRYVHILHVDGEGQEHEGEIICNKYIANDVLEIFEELYNEKYPIEKVRLVDEYDADDERSMADNNSSSFNYRLISYSDTISKHGLGMAVDINPRYNPYVKYVDGELSVEPANGTEYADRDKDFPYKIGEDDLAYKLFTERGFEWGGDWEDEKDYQHFEMPDEVVERLYPDE